MVGNNGFYFAGRCMLVKPSYLLLSASVTICLICPSLAQQQPPAANGENLFSPLVADLFHRISYELAASDHLRQAQLEQAAILLRAAAELNPADRPLLEDMIRLLARDTTGNYSELMHKLLVDYIEDDSDLAVVRAGVAYLLNRADSREQREQFLATLLQTVSQKNNVVDSELITELALLAAEKSDSEAARNYFIAAYNKNNHNRLAFAKLSELLAGQLKPAIYLEQFRLFLLANPLDIEVGLALARKCEQYQLFETAADAYTYCADLFKYLHPSRPLPPIIYIPWALSSMNTARQLHRCLEIAAEVRNSGRFDLLLEAIAGRAARKMGDNQRADRILQAAEATALELLTDPTQADGLSSEQMAWFYCFAMPDANKAVIWANKAFAAEPNSNVAAGILAYALVLNAETESARMLVESAERTQIGDLALARLQIAAGQIDLAVETLKSVVKSDPGSLAARRAHQLLSEQGAQYIAGVDPGALLAQLQTTFGDNVVPHFMPPGKIVTLGLKLRGTRFSYGSDFDGRVGITNNSSRPLLISGDAMLKGRIRIDANVTGDLEARIPKLVSIRIQPTAPIEPGKTYFVPVRLNSATLRELLTAHPQASLIIDFTVYLDPVVDDSGAVSNALPDISPATARLRRLGVRLTTRYLQNRLDSLRQGQQGQRIRAGALFAGLLKEQHALLQITKKPYEFAYADWMPKLLKSALARNLADDAWVVRVHTLLSLLHLPLDYELTRAAAENLNAHTWPVRMAALYLLAQAQENGFSKVLDWTAAYDSNELVRRMAAALGGKPAQTEPQTPSRPAQ